MKLITAFLHHVRVAPVVDALNDAGYNNFTLQDVKGTLRPLGEYEQIYSSESRLVISEAKLSVVCDENQVAVIADIISNNGRIGTDICGWIYVSTVDGAFPIGGLAK